jgi:type II secretory pathway component PulF
MKRFIRYLRNNIGEARIEDVGFLLDLLESGCTRDEIETSMNLKLHAQETLRRFVQRKRMNGFNSMEADLGFGFALNLYLNLRLRKYQETSFFIRTITYPCILILTGICVLALNLFLILPTITANNFAQNQNEVNLIPTYQAAFIIGILLFLISSCIFLYLLRTRTYRCYLRIFSTFPTNPWVISIGREMAFHLRKFHLMGLSTREIHLKMSVLSGEPVIAGIAAGIVDEYREGKPVEASLMTLDPFLYRILRFENHPDFAESLATYDRIAQKRYDHSVKKIGYAFSIIAYLFISLLIIAMYQEIMAPLEMLRNMG